MIFLKNVNIKICYYDDWTMFEKSVKLQFEVLCKNVETQHE